MENRLWVGNDFPVSKKNNVIEIESTSAYKRTFIKANDALNLIVSQFWICSNIL